MDLMGTIAVPITDEQRVALLRVEREDFLPVMKRVKKDYGFTDEHLAAGILALKQYYAVAILDAKNRHAVSDMVDPFWHTHVLFTKEYYTFSHDVFDKYMHHEPLDHDDVERVNFVEGVYNYTLDVYGKVFNSFDEVMNPRVESDRICCVMGSGITPDQPLYAQGLFPPIIGAREPQGRKPNVHRDFIGCPAS